MKSRKLDQFYTRPSIAKKCLEYVTNHYDLESFDKIIEPSAGNGVFYLLFDKNKRIGFDIDPKGKDIIEMDYLTYEHTTESAIVIGNPPFGKNSSLAIKFINHSVYAEAICFILPKTFRKTSTINKITPKFHLVADYDLPLESFTYNKKLYSVPCCFQIWEKKSYPRKKIYLPSTHYDFKFVRKNDDYDFLIQRVGGAAGKIKSPNEKWSENSHLYVKSNIRKEELLKRFQTLNFNAVKFNTAGNPSVSKTEIIKIYSEKYPGIFI